MLLHLSVSYSVHRGCLAGHPLGIHPHWADTPLGNTHTPWAATPTPADTPTRWPMQQMVRILLECILVTYSATSFYEGRRNLMHK